MYPTRSEMDDFFESLGRRWALDTSVKENSVEYQLTKGQRRVVFRWDSHWPEEMWFVFGSDGRWEFEDWTEMSAPEEKSIHFEYLESLAERYLESTTRLRRRWRLFGAHILQYQRQGSWHDMRKAIQQPDPPSTDPKR